MDTGLWDTGEELLITTVAGPSYRLCYIERQNTDIGQCFAGRHVMAYLASGENNALARKGYEVITQLTFANERMREAMDKQLPTPLRMGLTGPVGGRWCPSSANRE
jgi:hypothetical protein